MFLRFKTSALVYSLCIYLLFIPGSDASFSVAGDSDGSSRFEQRKLYTRLIGYITSNQRSKFEAEKGKLKDYALYPYLDYTDKIQHLSRQSPGEINQFSEQYKDTPLADQLIQNWLYSLAKRGQWQTFLDHYDPNADNTSENNCYYAYSLYQTGATELADQVAMKLWVVDYSQPKQCDPAFKQWRDAGGLTDEIAWNRFELALTRGKVRLAKYLERFLDRENKALADRFLQIHQKPNTLRLDQRLLKGGAKTNHILQHGVRRLANRSPTEALKKLDELKARNQFSEEELTDLYTYVAIRLARNPDSIDLLEDLPIDLTLDQGLVEAQLLTNLKQLNWSNTLVYLNLLDEPSKASDRWIYWKARILLGSVEEQDRASGEQLMRSIAEKRSFYGFMAADQINLQYNFKDEPENITREQILSLESTPGIQRALELFALNEKTRARREWNFTTKNFSVIELQIAAHVAQKWGWHTQAIRAMIAAKAWDDLALRFPLAYQDNFLAGARTEDIPVSWSLAIARQESAFMADAKSSAGAIGIMQLMPGTARSTAAFKGMRFTSSSELTNPQFNIKLGSAYLGRMLRRFDQNRIIASAAYNAGPNRVDKWVNNGLPIDVWIETIPYAETRNYVQNVLMFSAIYSRKLDQPNPLFLESEKDAFFNPQTTATAQRDNDSSP